MTFLADLCTLLVLAGLALVHDPESLDPLAPRLPLAALLIPAALLAAALTRRPLAFRPADALVAAALALTAAGAAASGAPWDSGPALAAAGLATGAYLLGRRAGERAALLDAAAAGSLLALVAASVTMLGAYAQPAGPDLARTVPTRALVGPLANPDLMAAWIVLVLPLAAAGRAGRVALALGTVALAWTLSRGALLALAAAAYLTYARGAARPGRRPVALALVALLVLTGFAAVRPADRAKLTGTATFVKRLAIWRTALDLCARHPLFGHGPGRFGALYEVARPADPTGPARLPPSQFAHDLPLQVAVEHGLAGLALLACALAGLARRVAQATAATSATAAGTTAAPCATATGATAATSATAAGATAASTATAATGAAAATGATDPLARALACGLAAAALHNLVSHALYTLPILLLTAFLTGACVTRGRSRAVASPRAYPLACVLAALLLFLTAPWALCENRAQHGAGVAQTLLTRGDPRAAGVALAALTEAPNRPAVRYVAASALAESNRPAAALAQLLLLEAQVPHFGHEPYLRARILLDQNRPAPALASLERELTADPTFFQAWYSKAEALYMSNDPRGCQTALDRARALAPTPDWTRRLDALAAQLAPRR